MPRPIALPLLPCLSLCLLPLLGGACPSSDPIASATETTTDDSETTTTGPTTGPTTTTVDPTTTTATTTSDPTTTTDDPTTTTDDLTTTTDDPTTTTDDPTTTSDSDTDSDTDTDTGVLPASCVDGVLSEDETDIDCGGPVCDPCASGLACEVDDDCQSMSCVDQLCAGPSCDDGELNGEETDVDCGGPDCEPCLVDQICVIDEDCYSDLCDNEVCVSTCDDGVQNGLETDIDCGGPFCAPCGANATCEAPDDCESKICDEGFCTLANCEDGVQNGDEEGVDCGGELCAPCTLNHLLINEVDYDQPLSDTAEYIEIFNGTESEIDLEGYQIVLINGGPTPPQVYGTIDLGPAGALKAGQYLVIAPPNFQVEGETLKIDFPGAANQVQNGPSDGIALVDTNKLTLVDSLAYEDGVEKLKAVEIPLLGEVSLIKGEPFLGEDSNDEDGSLSRIPNGKDTKNDAADWAYTTKLTPGTANAL